MTEPARVRKNPCPTCPLRRDCPSGLWHADEYEVLRSFDGDMAGQAVAPHGLSVFHCHQGDGTLCAGWAGFRDPADILAIRAGIASGVIHPDALDYKTGVPLFATGAEAAAHGLRDYDHPGPDATRAALKIGRVRDLRGAPLAGMDDQETP